MADIKRVIALGFFDGVHRGHGELLCMAKRRAAEYGMIPSVLSFDVHPDTLIFNSEVQLINSAEDRRDIIKRIYGIEDLVFIHFDRRMMCMPWREFIDCTVSELNVGRVVMGHDFCCGYKGEGKAELISEYCIEKGIGCDIIPALCVDGRVISSTWIRQLLDSGDIKTVNRLLGHPHTLTDTVRSGYHLGTSMGTPTVNMLFPNGVLVPKRGVYASRVCIDDDEVYTAVTNIGIRPTVGNGDDVSVESHLLGFSGNLYGKKARLELLDYIREEKKFDSLDELSEQIQRDIEAVKLITGTD